MNGQHGKQRLDQTDTNWTDVFGAHQGTVEAIQGAQQRLLARYEAAIRSYVYALLRDQDAVNEVFQELALRLIRGSFKGAHPDLGRFRDFLKTTLCHLIADHQSALSRQPLPLSAVYAEPWFEETPMAEVDQSWLSCWRGILLLYAEGELVKSDQRTGRDLAPLWRLHVAEPELKSPRLAEELTRKLQRSISPEWVRKWLGPARDQVADAFLDQLAHLLPYPTPDNIETKVIELGLLAFCRDALERRRESIWN